MPVRYQQPTGLPATGATSITHVLEDADIRKGNAWSWESLSTGPQSGNTTIDVAHIVSAQISFTAPNTVQDNGGAGTSFTNVLATDTITFKGTGSNDGTYTIGVKVGNGELTLNEAVVTEVAGAYVKVYKRATHANAIVRDLRSLPALEWSRDTTTGAGTVEPVGTASAGLLAWYDSAKIYALHVASAAGLSIVTPNILRVEDGNLNGELGRYDVGDVIDCTLFTNGVNNLPGYVITAVTVNGDDIDLTLDIGDNNTLVAETADADATINLVCDSVFAYCAAANAASLGGYGDWRVPNANELHTLINWGANPPVPPAAQFPDWATAGTASNGYHSSTSSPVTNTNKIGFRFDTGASLIASQTTQRYLILVRGGVN